jgi:three-Cys-motif partner protein
MQIVIDYAKAYLTIMGKQPWAKTLYFDGFAGSGEIEIEKANKFLKGAALQILDVNTPKPFDLYYFVELNEEHKRNLEDQIRENYSDKKDNTHVVRADCNDKLKDMAHFLRDQTKYRALAFIDPYGMSVNWSSIEVLKGLGIDLWILVPTGMGVNRLLKKDGEISKEWISKLEMFLGLSKEEIFSHFYKTHRLDTLFGEYTIIEKEKQAIGKIGEVYSKRLKEIFAFVSEPFIIKNRNNAIMYHFMMATNNPAALKIANDVIKPKYKL